MPSLRVNRIKSIEKTGLYADDQNLYLKVKSKQSKSWVFGNLCVTNLRMNLNKDIIDFKEPELRKKVDRIQYEREMTSIAIFLFLEKISKFFGISQSQFKQ